MGRWQPYDFDSMKEPVEAPFPELVEPDPEPVDSSQPGSLEPISVAASCVVHSLRSMLDIAPDCESPIEVQFGGSLKSALAGNDWGVELVPQYKLGRYRFDFAIIGYQEKLLILIECDGKAFHSTDEQIENDRRKNLLACDYGATMLRFSGSDIYRRRRHCIQHTVNAIKIKLGLKE